MRRGVLGVLDTLSLLLSRLCRWRHRRRRVMPRRTSPDDRSTPLHTTPRMTTPRGNSRGADSEGGLSIGRLSPSEPRSPHWSPLSSPMLSPQQIEELQPADEEQALAHAVERSLSYRASEPSVESAEAEQLRLESEEAATITTLLALPTQPWAPALSRIRDSPEATHSAADEQAEPVHQQMEEADECAMCMEPFVEADLIKMLRCRHYFHAPCIDKWLVHGQQGKERSCPVCSERPI